MLQQQTTEFKQICQQQSCSVDIQERLGFSQISQLKQNDQISNQSQNFDVYKQFMGLITMQKLDNLKNQIYQQCQNIKISEKWNPTIKIQVIKTNSQSVMVEISLGHFLLKANVFKIKVPYIESGYMLGRGATGSVMGIQYENKQIAIKAILLKKEDYDFQDIYRQFIFAKVAECLKIGVPLISIFGYDLVFFEDYAVFCMEKCLTEHTTLAKRKSLKKQLTQSLAKLHALKICHCDIKTSNIAISPLLRKPVFLDFGLTRILQQKVGFKSMCNFSGTYKYCSQQMKKLYFLKQKKYIDVYYNDAVCLQNTLQQLQSYRNQSIIEFLNSSSFQNNIVDSGQKRQFLIAQFINVARLKYFIFLNKYEEAIRLVVSEKKMIKSMSKIYHEENLYAKCYPVNKEFYNFIYHRYNSLLKLLNMQQQEAELNVEQMTAQILHFKIKSKKVFRSTDETIYQYYNKFHEDDFAFNELHWLDIISSKQFKNIRKYVQKFEKLWQNGIFRQKLFLYLVPCPDGNQRLNIKQNTLRKQKIIYNVFKCLSEMQGIDKVQDQPHQIPLSFKLRFILCKFMECFEQNFNSQYLHSLRLMFLKIEDLVNLNRVQQIILNHYKTVQQDIGMWIIKKIQFYLAKPLLLNNGIEEYIRESYQQIRNTKLIYQGVELNIDEYQLMLESHEVPQLNQQSSLYLFKQIALTIFDVNQLAKQDRSNQILQIIEGLVYMYPEGRLQKQIVQSKIISCQDLKGHHWTTTKIEQKIESSLYKNNNFNRFMAICHTKQTLFSYSNSCKTHQQNFHRPHYQMGFNQFLITAFGRYQNNSQKLLDICLRHLKLYDGNYEYLNELIWISLIRNNGIAKFNVLPNLIQQYLTGACNTEMSSIFKIDRCIRNLRELTKYFIMCHSETINKVAGQLTILQLLNNIKQTYNSLLRQARKLDEDYCCRSYNVKLVELNLAVADGHYDKIVSKIKTILKQADYYKNIGEVCYWWVFTLMGILINPKFQLPHYHHISLSYSSYNIQDSIRSYSQSQKDYEYKCRIPLIQLVMRISQQFSKQVIYSEQFVTLCVHAHLLTLKYHECYEYLKEYANAFEKYHHHKIAGKHSFIYLKQVSKFCIYSPIQILIQICKEFHKSQNMQSFQQFRELGTLLTAIFIKVHCYINNHVVKKRLLNLCSYGLGKASIAAQLQFTTSIYEIHKSLYTYQTARKQLCCSKRQAITNFQCNMKYWLTLAHKKIGPIRKKVVKQNLQTKFKAIKYNHYQNFCNSDNVASEKQLTKSN